MDFNRANKMLDEINGIFAVVENRTKEINEIKHESEMEMLKGVIVYFRNWAELFDKTIIPNKRTGKHIHFHTEKGSPDTWELEVRCFSNNGEHMLNKRGISDDYAIILHKIEDFEHIEIDMADHIYRNHYADMIKNIDFDYVEEQLVNELHHAIELKAAYIEAEYQKAIAR